MRRTTSIRFYLDIIRPSGAKTKEELEEMLKEAIEESKKLTEWPDPEDYR